MGKPSLVVFTFFVSTLLCPFLFLFSFFIRFLFSSNVIFNLLILIFFFTLAFFGVYFTQVSNRPLVKDSLQACMKDTDTYLFTLYYFIVNKGSYSQCPFFNESENKSKKIRLFSMALVFKLWDEKHYRHGTF